MIVLRRNYITVYIRNVEVTYARERNPPMYAYAEMDATVHQHWRAHDFQAAGEYLSSLLPAEGERLGVILAHQAINLHRSESDKTLKALDVSDRALTLLAECPEREIRVLINAAHMTRLSGSWPRAQRYLEKMLHLIEAGTLEIVPWRGMIYSAVGLVHKDMGRNESALDWLKKARQFYLDHPGPFGEPGRLCGAVIAREALCYVHAALGDNESAREMFAETQLLLAGTNSIDMETRHSLRAIMAFACGQYSKAIEEFSEAIRICASVGDPLMLTGLIDGLIRSHKCQGTIGEFFATAVDLQQQLTGRPLLRLQKFTSGGDAE